MKDIARAAGVSTATVSRVAANSAFVEEATRRRVLKAMKDLKYVPNLLAKGLKNKSGGFIGLVVREVARESFLTMIHDFEDLVSERDFTLLLVFNRGRDAESEAKIIQKLVGRHADGIILLSPFAHEESFRSIRDVKIPVVFFGSHQEVAGIHRVTLDEYETGRLAGRCFADSGHRKLFCVTGPQGELRSRSRLEGFRQALRERGIELPDSHVHHGDFELASGTEAANRIAREKLDITGVWFQNDLMALGGIGEFQRLGIRVPHDISIIGMDDITYSSYCSPRLTTISLPIREMTEKAVELLLKIRDGREDFEAEIVFQPKLIVRESVAIIEETQPRDGTFSQNVVEEF